MVRRGIGAWFGIGMFAIQGAGAVAGAEPPPALTVRLVRPDRQCERLLALFQGARAPHPAAALAAWKRATAPHGQLGKSLEAAIAAFNPEMVGELRGLDQAELVVVLDPVDGSPRWYATLPRDDGAFAAVATAMALTDGGSEPPIGAVAVDRVGPPGSTLAARTPGGLALAGSRSALAAAIDPARPRPTAAVTDEMAIESGWLVRVVPEGLGRSGPSPRRRMAEALRGLGCRVLDASARLDGETLAMTMTMTMRLDAPSPPTATIDPAWLDALPAAGLLSAFAWAIGPGPEAWDRAFAIADRVERADPAHADVAPLRTRINLLAVTVGVHPEVELWPRLRGVSGAVLVDPRGRVEAAILDLHADGPDSARRIAEQVLPRLAFLLGIRPGPAAEVPQKPRPLGRYRDRPLSLIHERAAVRLVWGESAAGLPGKVGANRDRSAGDVLRAHISPGEAPPQRLGAFWPGRLALTTTVGEPMARTIAEAPPVVWIGRDVEVGAREVVSWTGLRPLVHRFLERVPLDPPPDP